MRPYVIRQGDYLAALAQRFGFDADEVWQHPRNESLRSLRQNPQQLAPGDILRIPERRPRRLSVRVGDHNEYSATVPEVSVRFTLREGTTVMADEPYEVLGLPAALRGRTDAEGRVEFSVPTHTRSVVLVFPELRMRVPVVVGGIDPVDTPSGVRQRLANLGLHVDSQDASESGMEREERERLAVMAFQRRRGLAVTGAVDEDTRRALQEAHDGTSRR